MVPSPAAFATALLQKRDGQRAVRGQLMALDESLKTAQDGKAKGPDLRLLDRRAFVGFPPLEVAPGITLNDFALQIPDATFPFSVTGGPARYQKKKLQFGLLEVTIDAEVIRRQVAEVASRLLELDELKLHFRPGYLEGQARIKSADPTPVTFKIAFDGEGERLAVYLYDVRLYGFSSTPACQVPLLLARSVQALELLPDVEGLGAVGFTTRVLPKLCQHAAVARGYKMPTLDGARLSSVDVTGLGLRLRFASGGLPPPTAPDEALLLTLEGVRAFADAEALIAAGKLGEARDSYLRASDPAEAHPFAAERLLGLLVADPGAHELALDIAGALARRRENSPVALWAEAVVRERRGESARAAERYLALCALSRKNSEETAAFFAAESAARAARDQAPQVAVKALHEVLGLRPDHLPSLRALARASDHARDRAGAIRAYRRLTALARDPADAADAHVQLARLCALTEDDVAGARLHCEAALRLAPDHPEALYQLGELCYRAGEHLRALKALDRLKDVAIGRHELDRVGRAHMMAGRVWELGLKQLDNALLRFREAVSLLPGEPEPLFHTAQVAEALGRLQEAIAGYVQTVELAGPAPKTPEIRTAAHAAHRALARLYKTRLPDPTKAREHLEAAFALDPTDVTALEELLPALRSADRLPELADALEKGASLISEPGRRATLLAEAGELYRGRLSQPEKAERLLNTALDADPRNRVALEAVLALSEARRDGGALCRVLKTLAELCTDAKERVRYYRRLVVAAKDIAFDLELAALALAEVLKAEPEDLPALGDLCAIQRKRSDMHGLAQALEQRARVAEHQRDVRLASAALRELAQVLEVRLGRPGEALIALEKAARLAPEMAVLMELAEISLRCERPEHARRALEDVLSALPRHASPERFAEVHARLGKACDMLGDRDAAASHYAQALPLRRLDDELTGRLEALYHELGRTAELSELWSTRAQALLAADRPEAAAPLLLKSARLLLDAGHREAAFHKLSSSLELSPHGPHAVEALDLLAGLELLKGNRLEAAKLLAREAGLVAEPRASARLLFKAAELAAGSLREEGLLGEALAQDSTFAPARARRGELLLLTHPERALEDLEAALSNTDTGMDALKTQERVALHRKAAQAATHLHRPDVARNHLTAYVNERPEDLEALEALTQLLRSVGALDPLVDALAVLAPRLEGDRALAAFREHAEVSLELGRPQLAVASLREILSRSSNDAAAAAQLLKLFSEGAGQALAGERMRLLSLLVTAGEPAARAHHLIQRAQLFRDLEKPAEALADLLLASEHVTDKGPLLHEAAELARSAGDEASELKAWRLAVQADGALGEIAAPRLTVLARSRLEALDFVSAAEGFAEAVQWGLSSPEQCEAYFGLAEALLKTGDVPASLNALENASRQGPPSRRMEAHLRRAALAEAEGLIPEALQSLNAALMMVPRHLEATSSLRRVLIHAQDWAGLAERVAVLAKQAPEEEAGPVYAELGFLYLEKLEQKGPAEAALRKAAALGGTDASVHRALFRLLLDRGAWMEAAELAEATAQALPPKEAAELLREGAGLSEAVADNVLAVAMLRKAHALVPATGEALYLLAEVLYRTGAQKEALPVLAAVSEEIEFSDAPDRAEALLLAFADVSEAAGEVGTAETAYRRILGERPRSASAAERLARLLGRTDPRAAVELLARFTEDAVPSEASARQFVALALRARDELADVELAVKLLRQAAPMMQDPLPVHHQLVDLLRDAGQTQPLMEALRHVAALSLKANDVKAALAAQEEVAVVAECAGRVDDALRAFEDVVALSLKANQKVVAAEYERRQAELLRDAKQDFGKAQEALERAFKLYPSLETAQLGSALAHHRQDFEREAGWVTWEIDCAPSASAREEAQLRLAKLYLDKLQSRAKAEAVLRDALAQRPGFEEAGHLLVRTLEEDGRLGEVGTFYEELAARATSAEARISLFQRAASVYRDRTGNLDAAAAALLAARSVNPGDATLTGEAADALEAAGRGMEAAEFDALLLDADPFRSPSFERHLRYLDAEHEHGARAALMLARAQRQEKLPAAESYLSAAASFRAASADERARLCERQAFEEAPQSDAAFLAVRDHVATDVRKLAEVLAQRARAVPADAPALLEERAERLAQAGEAILAAEAFDELLSVDPDNVHALFARAELAAQGGGPRAAQPYDRKILRLASDTLGTPVLLKIHLRLGQASLAANAFQDATDALEAAVALDPSGARSREALSMLMEAHGKTGNTRGLYRTSLALAEGAKPDEAEALYRHAAELFSAPQESVDALLPLARLRPADSAVVDRAVEALAALGRDEERVALLEKGAAAAGGRRGADLLLQAADVAQGPLMDGDQALLLTQRAAALDPTHTHALRRLADEYRDRGDSAAVEGTLTQLIAIVGPSDEASLWRLELAGIALSAGAPAKARDALEAVWERGPKGAGFADALPLLQPLLNDAKDAALRADVLEARSGLVQGPARAELLLLAGRAALETRDWVKATRLSRSAIAAEASLDGYLFLASLWGAQHDPSRQAQALVQAAGLCAEAARPGLLLEAAEAWEAAGETQEARETLERIASDSPRFLSSDALAQRLGKLGAAAQALAVGFGPLMARGAFTEALGYADAARDGLRIHEALWALAREGAHPEAVERLLPEVAGSGTEEQKVELALLAHRESLPALEAELLKSIVGSGAAPTEKSLSLWLSTLERMIAAGDPLSVLPALAHSLTAEAPAAWCAAVLTQLIKGSGEAVETLLEHAADALPTRRVALLGELFDRATKAHQFDRAALLLQQQAAATVEPQERSEFTLALGELYLHALGDMAHAREAFEQVLVDAPESEPALRFLMSLYRESEPERYVATVERLTALLGPGSTASEQPALASAYEGLGRLEDADATLARLEETPERLGRRVALAQRLGWTEAALSLRERATQEPGALGQLAHEYLAAGKPAAAVALSRRLLKDAGLPAELRKSLILALGATREGAALACEQLSEALGKNLVDPECWRQFASALNVLGKENASRLALELHDALAGSEEPLPPVQAAPFKRTPLESPSGIPTGSVSVTAQTMPQLAAALQASLAGLGAAEIQVWLNPAGGAEAYLANDSALVLGAGALSHFRAVELGYLMALALALGDEGQTLKGFSTPQGFTRAAELAFDAVPTALGAGRVLGRLDSTIRGSDAGSPEARKVLFVSDAFLAVCQRVLALASKG